MHSETFMTFLLSDIVRVVSEHILDYTNWKGSHRNLCEPEDMPIKQTIYLYQTIAKWITTNNDLFGLCLSKEFLEMAHGKRVEVPRVNIGYI